MAKLNITFNLHKDNEDTRDYSFAGSPLAHAKLPKAVDHSMKMSSVKNQGKGSCVGFAIIAAVSGWSEHIKHNKEVLQGKQDHIQSKDYNLSESWIYWNAKQIDPWPDIESTSLRHGIRALYKIGVPTEDAWLYNDINISKPESWAYLTTAQWSLIKSYYRCRTLDEIRSALTLGPVIIGMGCFEEIFKPDEYGIVEYPMKPQFSYGGHAVCAVSYDDATQLIKFKNSWGTAWGVGGYGRFRYRYIQDFLWDAWAIKDLAITKNMLAGTRTLNQA